MVMKKKSRSIDTKKLEHGHVQSYSMKKLEPKTAKIKFEKPFAKKSVDWSMNISDSKHQIL